MNTIPCGKCRHADPIVGPKRAPSPQFVRCTQTSVYPSVEGPGQRFPPGVKRAAPGAMPKIDAKHIDTVESNCRFAEVK